MGLKELLNQTHTSQENNELRCQLRDLLKLAAIDGEVTEKESLFIFNLFRREGIQVEKISENLMAAPDAYPNELNLRMKHLTRLVALMMIDGECSKNEIIFCKNIAVKLEIEEQAVSKLVAVIASQKNSLLNEIDRETAVLSFLANGGYNESTKQDTHETFIRQKIRIGFDQIVKKATSQIQYDDAVIIGLSIKLAIAKFYQHMKDNSTCLSFCAQFGINYQNVLREECNYALQKYLEE